MLEPINRTILGPSTIRLFGWVLTGVVVPLPPTNPGQVFVPAAAPPNALQPGQPLAGYQGQSLLTNTLINGDRVLAHILAYSYGGVYSALRVPALFLVRGPGQSVWLPLVPPQINRQIDPGRLGLAHLDGIVQFADDLMFWTYDQSDQTIRLDPSSGTLQQLVIDAETGGAHGHRRIDLVGQDGSFSGRLGVS
jgi:hypothetical protein